MYIKNFSSLIFLLNYIFVLFLGTEENILVGSLCDLLGIFYIYFMQFKVEAI